MGLAEEHSEKKERWLGKNNDALDVYPFTADPGPYFLQLFSSRIFPLGARISLITGDRIRSSAIAPHLASATNVA
jgi:hypothetical protein